MSKPPGEYSSGRDFRHELPSKPKEAENRTLEIIEEIRRDGVGVKSFLELVPAPYRDRIRDQADESHPFDRQGRSFEEFREDMALNWLARRRYFTELGSRLGLEETDRVRRNEDADVLAFTTNGSVILATRPDEDNNRLTLYIRIKEREDYSFPLDNRHFGCDIKVGDNMKCVPGFTTSPLIHLMKAARSRLRIRDVADEVSTQFMKIDQETRC